jgi:hypothetical protein
MRTALLLRASVLAAAAVGASGVSAQSDTARARDPLEGFNRAVFGVNEALDRALLTPLAKGYQAVVPELVRTGVSNVFGNIGDGWSAINQALQGKGEAAATMTMRVAANTLFGIGGLFDVASDLGMERQSEDFGQTLGHGPGALHRSAGARALDAARHRGASARSGLAPIAADRPRTVPLRDQRIAVDRHARQPAERIARGRWHRAGQVLVHPRCVSRPQA